MGQFSKLQFISIYLFGKNEKLFVFAMMWILAAVK